MALWREGLLARAVLHGSTRGYRHQPQLRRFQAHPEPHRAINSYLASVLEEATRRGYSFDASKVEPMDLPPAPITSTTGQLEYEWLHLLDKLQRRNPALHERWRTVTSLEPHPLFTLRPGPVEPWERID